MQESHVTQAKCAELRRAAARGIPVPELADTYRVDPATVKRHVWGNCTHTVDEPPMPVE